MSIKEKLKNLTTNPGVYQMFDKQDQVIYVGKAKNLKNRVSNYFVKTHEQNKTRVLVANTKDFKVIVTATETQALLLESELIKQHMPRYNILLKDSKSYPYIFISHDKHPRVDFYRGKRHQNAQYFGPYPSAHMVRDSLNLLKKIFKVRQCTNSTYQSRSKPCLEYQIGLCSAPCVSKISDENYQSDVLMMSLFLSGKGRKTLEKVSKKMQLASQNLEFELAARLRDQLIDLRTIQEQHTSSASNDLDVVSIAQQDGVSGVEVLFIRSGKQIGQVFILPKNSNNQDIKQVLSAFLPLYYLDKNIPKQILISQKLSDKKTIASALNTHIIDTSNKDKQHYLNIANLTAKENLNQNLLSRFRKKSTLVHLQVTLGLDKLPNYIECFDINHMMGEATVASCVVFEKGVLEVSQYCQFDIKNITSGDDYAAMNQVVYRRYSKLLKDKKPLPDIIFIDGGLGQFNQVIMVMNSIGVDDVQLVGIAKGENLKTGLETLITVKDDKVNKINLPPYDPALMLVKRIRDESHRFAIKNYRKKCASRRTISILESIIGVGKLRGMTLLNYFGGFQEVKKASIHEIQKVSGINLTLATKIVEKLKD